MDPTSMAKILKSSAEQSYKESTLIAKRLKKGEIQAGEFETEFLKSRMDYYLLKAQEKLVKPTI